METNEANSQKVVVFYVAGQWGEAAIILSFILFPHHKIIILRTAKLFCYMQVEEDLEPQDCNHITILPGLQPGCNHERKVKKFVRKLSENLLPNG